MAKARWFAPRKSLSSRSNLNKMARNLSTHAKARSIVKRLLYASASNCRLGPRFTFFRLRLFSLIFGYTPWGRSTEKRVNEKIWQSGFKRWAWTVNHNQNRFPKWIHRRYSARILNAQLEGKLTKATSTHIVIKKNGVAAMSAKRRLVWPRGRCFIDWKQMRQRSW